MTRILRAINIGWLLLAIACLPMAPARAAILINPYRFSPGGTNYMAEVLADSPVGYWRLGEASGTTMTDSSGNAHDGTYVNTPTLASTGAVTGNDAVQFTATSLEYGTVSDRAALDITGACTVEAWVKVDSYSANNRGIISKSVGGGRSYLLFISSTGKLSFGISQTGAAYVICTGATALGTSAFRHVVGVFTPSSRMEVFIDEVSDGALTSGVPTGIVANTNELTVGAQYSVTDTSQVMNGKIDEVAIYSSALSSARIAAHYAARNTP